jgi:glutathione S-transferase
MSDLTLYGLSRSVYTRIARLALEEKGVAYGLEEVDIFGKGGVPADHRKRHPFGRIPVLVHGDFSLYETGAITRYIDESFPGPGLQPANPRLRARMNQIIGLLDAYAYRPMVWGVFVQRVSVPLQGGSTDEQTVSNALPVVETCINVLGGMLSGQPYLAGDNLTLADLHAAPMLLYLTLALEGKAMLSKRPELERWLASIRMRRSVEKTRSIYELEQSVGV